MEIEFDQEARDWLSQESVEWLSSRWGLSQEASSQFLSFFSTVADLLPSDLDDPMDTGDGDQVEIAESLLASFEKCLKILKSEVGTESPGYRGTAKYGSLVILRILREYWEGTEKSVGDAEGIRPILARLGACELPFLHQIVIKGFQDKLPISKVSIVIGILAVVVFWYYLISWLF